jgi:hypothetical protein
VVGLSHAAQACACMPKSPGKGEEYRLCLICPAVLTLHSGSYYCFTLSWLFRAKEVCRCPSGGPAILRGCAHYRCAITDLHI